MGSGAVISPPPQAEIEAVTTATRPAKAIFEAGCLDMIAMVYPKGGNGCPAILCKAVLHDQRLLPYGM